MLFSSFEFIFYFFPLVVSGYFLLQNLKLDQYKSFWLLITSICFYIFWQWEDLIPLIISTSINYAIYKVMVDRKEKNLFLWLGISFNLLFLAWYKYPILYFNLTEGAIPLGISFYTFTQIAFLVDGFKQQFKELSFSKYALFVGYFPHLVCGPILIFKDFYPQITQKAQMKIDTDNVVYFLFFFSIGLFKKTFIADPLGLYVSFVFDAAPGIPLDFRSTLLATLCYSFQLYADFSGYTDMAVGLSKLFGITIPFNFNSPYQSPSIIEFWRRWHMSLANFLKNYVYIPLGGNRTTMMHQSFNLLIVFVLGGIWHGSSLTFLIWGFYHGVLLALNHFLRQISLKLQLPFGNSKYLLNTFKVLLTFGLVCLGWLVFRSNNIHQAYDLFRSIFLLENQEAIVSFTTKWQYIAILLGGSIAFILPETHHLYEKFISPKALERKTLKRILPIAGAISGVLLALGILLLSKPQQFLYSGF